MEHKYKNIYELKQLIKLHAIDDRLFRLTRKKNHDEKLDVLNEENWRKLKEASEKYDIFCGNSRLYYIAYGLLRGRQYNVIETPKLGNELTTGQWEIIKHIMDKFPMEKYDILKEETVNA